MYALARYMERKNLGPTRLFSTFVSTGEMLENIQRDTIERVLKCKVANRYGAAEFGVMAQECADRSSHDLLVSDSMVWPELYEPDSDGVGEFVFTGLRNSTMPLIRYRMGDRGSLEEHTDGWWIPRTMGRIHDMVSIDGTIYPTHFVQDILDRCGPVLDFQIATSGGVAQELRLVTEIEQWDSIKAKVSENFPNIPLRRIQAEELLFSGRRGKFRYVVDVENSV